MNKKAIVKKLLSLSKTHLHLVAGENWEEWESVADQKGDLYKKLKRLNNRSLHEEEKKVFFEIEKLEEQTKEELNKKRNEAEQELGKINRAKDAVKGYRKANKKGSGLHFDLKC